METTVPSRRGSAPPSSPRGVTRIACRPLSSRPVTSRNSQPRARNASIIPGGMRTHWFDNFPEQGIPLPDERHLQDPANVAEAILFAVRVPSGSVVQELMVTPLTETSWP